MAANLYNSAHKSTNPIFRDNYDQTFRGEQMPKITPPNPQAALYFARDCRIVEIQRNIRDRAAKLAELQAKLPQQREVKITEEHVVLIDGTTGVFLIAEGQPEGIFIDQSDLDSGAITLNDGYNAVSEMTGGNNAN